MLWRNRNMAAVRGSGLGSATTSGPWNALTCIDMLHVVAAQISDYVSRLTDTFDFISRTYLNHDAQHIEENKLYRRKQSYPNKNVAIFQSFIGQIYLRHLFTGLIHTISVKRCFYISTFHSNTDWLSIPDGSRPRGRSSVCTLCLSLPGQGQWACASGTGSIGVEKNRLRWDKSLLFHRGRINSSEVQNST